MDIDFTDNSAEVLAAFRRQCLVGLEKCGLTAEGYAKKLCPVNTGNLRNSITHTVDEGEPAAYIGSATSYAAHVECGTGKYYPGGRDTPWAFQDEQGHWHSTEGQPPKPFIKPAVADHGQTYKDIIEDALKDG